LKIQCEPDNIACPTLLLRQQIITNLQFVARLYFNIDYMGIVAEIR